MISYIKGTIEHISENFIVIDNQNMGYKIFVSPMTLSKLTLHEVMKIYTHMNVREDAIELFGFVSKEELEMFSLLITVSSIGPKVALAILNTMPPEKIMLSIVTDDILTLSKAQGVGKKTAQRIVLDLKDKIKTKDAVGGEVISSGTSETAAGVKEDAAEALVALGYSRGEAVRGVLEVYEEGHTVEQLIKLALKKVGGRV